jgi:DNA-binding transcriptional LysR family regulator
MTPYNITGILEWFKMRHPFLQIRIIEEGTAKLIQLLEEEQCDFAFVHRFRSNNDDLRDLLTLTLTSDVIVALISSRHPLAKEKYLSITQFENESVILPKGDLLYNKLVSTFNKAGYQPNTAFIGSRSDDVADMVRKGMGIAFMLKSSAHTISMDGISIHELDSDSDFVIDISMTYLKSKKMNPSCTSFLESVNTWISDHPIAGNATTRMEKSVIA